ncbi:MAG: DUF2071 domain-containing protein [Pirellulaceae bacterium]
MSEIDRVSPTRRPQGKNSGIQSWRDLFFLHWPVPQDALRKVVPSELEIDSHEGTAYVGLVPFQMKNICPTWLPRQFAFNFLETNVRTYVHYRGRPGVYFFSLDANSRIAVWAARIGWSLPYFYSHLENQVGETSLRYAGRRRKGDYRIEAEVGEQISPFRIDSLEYFLFERYLLFVNRKNLLHVGAVHHEPYQVHRGKLQSIEENMIRAAGLDHGGGAPTLVHYSPGVDVEVFGLVPA